MPHFGLMNSEKLGPEESALQRTRLHIRAAKRRLSQGKVSAGIATLFDALVHGMKWYLLSHEEKDESVDVQNEDTYNGRVLFDILVRLKVLDDSFDYALFASLTDDALQNNISDCDYQAVTQEVETVMTKLGIMPFDEDMLPAEDPATY
jgi:hypothetical protein